jgi:hypothetical protein
VRFGGQLGLMLLLALAGCGGGTGCLANRYDGTGPQRQCVGGLQLPYGLLKDTDPTSTPIPPTTLPRS